jgi:hypothetical protein
MAWARLRAPHRNLDQQRRNATLGAVVYGQRQVSPVAATRHSAPRKNPRRWRAVIPIFELW